MNHYFYSMVLRMKYVDRWGLMRNSRSENLSEHATDVAILVHALAVLGNTRFQKSYDPYYLATVALFHDVSEILTGDLPTPVKYQNPEIVKAYKALEQDANDRLLQLLPADLQPAYQPLLQADLTTEQKTLLKAADKLAALIKCMEEEHVGNQEFSVAKQAQLEALQAMHLAEVDCFLAEFLDGFGKTLDEQSRG